MTTESKHELTIFIDAVRYTVTSTSMTGSQIKALANIAATYQLFEEQEGDKDDKPISDTEAVHVRNDMHFFAIPQVTMGLGLAPSRCRS